MPPASPEVDRRSARDQPGVSQGSNSRPDTAAPKVGDLLVVKTQPVDSCLLACEASQGGI